MLIEKAKTGCFVLHHVLWQKGSRISAVKNLNFKNAFYRVIETDLILWVDKSPIYVETSAKVLKFLKTGVYGKS